MEPIPSALTEWTTLRRKLGRRVAIFLDYDGTLSPIVDRPEMAVLSPGMRGVLRELARLAPTVVISGRGRDDVEARVGLDELYYAGSHGFDIAGPPGSGVSHEVDPGLRPSIENARRRLAEGARGIGGAIVEDKRFSVSLHYRLAAEGDVGRLERLVDEVVAAEPRLRKAHGKMVFEVRPALDWDKGKALLWLLDALGLGPGVAPVYVGDDLTDEDAFAVVEGRGVGILVAESPRRTRAVYRLHDTGEVETFLERLVAFLRESPPRD